VICVPRGALKFCKYVSEATKGVQESPSSHGLAEDLLEGGHWGNLLRDW
jgi:hypothetical protein